MNREVKKLYRIRLDGCDDYTDIKISLDENEYELIKKVEKRSQEESTYGCMPTLSIEEIKNPNLLNKEK